MTIFRIHLFQFFNKIRIIRQCLVYFPSILVLFVLHSHICTFAYILKKAYKKQGFRAFVCSRKPCLFLYKIQSHFNVSTQGLQRRSEFLRYALPYALQTLFCYRIRTKRHTRQCRKYARRQCHTFCPLPSKLRICH